MARYSKKSTVSEETKQEAISVAKGIQKSGQTKAQTKLVAQGIQKGIELYKKQQKAKARELDKQNKKASAAKKQEIPLEVEEVASGQSKLPWVLLGASWLFFISVIIGLRLP